VSRIDEFRPDDVTEVGDLFMRVFAKQDGPASPQLGDYLVRLHFENPSYDPDRGCLVQRDAANRVVGFLAGYPLSMRCKGRPLRGVAVGTYMVDPRTQDPFGALRLVRAFLGRRPDVIFSDTANDVARRIWAAARVATDRLLSMGWARPLLPLRFSLRFWEKPRRRGPALLRGALDRLLSLPDAGINAIERGALEDAARGLAIRELSAETMAEAAPRVWSNRSLVPDYDRSHLEWMFAALAAKTRYGPLRKMAVHDGEDGLVGWYIYYPNRGDIGQVVQVAARPNDYGRVLRHLLLDARSRGSVGLVGRVDPRHTEDLSGCGCIMFQRQTWTLAHSPDAAASRALLGHDAMLSRMEGDWWTRLSANEILG